MERLANGYESESDRIRQDLAIAEAQLRDYQARLGTEFMLDAYLSNLTGLRDQLKAGLSGAAHEAGKEEGPSISELAERIKAVKAANSVEATPQRVGQKQSTAEEPITARIRRRATFGPASANAIDSQHSTPQASPEAFFHREVPDTPDPLNANRTYQDRVTSRQVEANRFGEPLLKP